jgi:hypothetical protein
LIERSLISRAILEESRSLAPRVARDDRCAIADDQAPWKLPRMRLRNHLCTDFNDGQRPASYEVIGVVVRLLITLIIALISGRLNIH